MKALKTICLIDDDSVYTGLMMKIICSRKLAEQTIVFANGKAALEYIEEKAHNEQYAALPDIMLLDLNMPVMNGWEFLHTLAHSIMQDTFRKNTVLFVVSSSINPDEIENVKKSPLVRDYYIKPLKVADLEKIVRKTKGIRRKET